MRFSRESHYRRQSFAPVRLVHYGRTALAAGAMFLVSCAGDKVAGLTGDVGPTGASGRVGAAVATGAVGAERDGAAGATGTRGPGFALTVTDVPFTVPTIFPQVTTPAFTVSCAAGYTAMSGGWNVVFARLGASNFEVLQSFRSASGQWQFQLRNTGTGNIDVNVFVTCAKLT